MPGIRDIVENLDDKEAKETKNLDVQQQAREEENAKQVSNLGNTSSSTEKAKEEEKAKEGSSTEAETVSETEGSQDLMIVKPSEKKNVGLPIKKRLKLSQVDQTHKAESKSIDSSEASNKELQGEAATNQREDLFKKLFGSDTGEKTKPTRVKLFETPLTRTNRLVIPAEAVENYLPPIEPGQEDDPMAELLLQITDDIQTSVTWYMAVVFYPEEDVFMVVKGWQDFASWHGLEPFDMIQFHRPIPSLATNHYTITYERRRTISGPEFTRENFLFLLELTSSDVRYSRLFIPSREVAIHFPVIQLFPLSKKKEIMKFTDITNKDWYMDVIRYNQDFYMIISEWNGFVKAHDLGAGDVIKFYKPVQPSHAKHFLIACVKKEGDTNANKKNGEPNRRDSDKGKKIVEIG